MTVQQSQRLALCLRTSLITKSMNGADVWNVLVDTMVDTLNSFQSIYCNAIRLLWPPCV